jgi:hypothetical protein
LRRIVHQELFDDLTKGLVSNEEVELEFEGHQVVDAKFIDDQDVMMILNAGGLIKPSFLSKTNADRSISAGRPAV